MALRDIGRSIGSFFRRLIRRPRAEISRTSVVAALALLFITIIALMVRILPILEFPILLRAFDPWFNYREVLYILENGFSAWFGWYDPSTWVPSGRNMTTSAYPGIPFTATLLYLGLRAVGIQVDVMTVCVMLPPLMGTLGVLVTYLLGQELVSKEVGLFAAFFMAILPAYTQRTIAGFFDNETIGIFAIVLTLFFFARTMRKRSIASAILGGLAMGYLAASWSVYLYIFQIFAIFAMLLILLRRYSRRLLLAYSGTVLGGFLIAICVPRIGPDFLTGITGLIPIAVFGLMLLIEFSRMFRLTERQMPGMATGLASRFRPYAPYLFGAMCGLVVVGLGYLFQSGLIAQLALLSEQGGAIGGIASKFQTVLNPLIRQTAQLLASVGEHLPAPWVTFWFNLNILVLVMPFGFYIAFRRERENDLLLVLFAITAIYFTGSMIRLALLLAPAAALMGAYGIISALRPFRTVYWQRPILTRRRRRITPPATRSFATITYIFVIFLLLSTTISSLNITIQMGAPEITPGGRQAATLEAQYARDYLEAFSWMQTHTPQNSIVLSWWDYGYWIRQVGNRSTVVDNATIKKKQIGWVGRLLMEDDPLEALSIAKQFGVNYVFVHYGLEIPALSGDEGKWQWMVRIAREVFGDEVDKEEEFWNPVDGTMYDRFYNSLLYNMLYLNTSGYASVPEDYPDVNYAADPAKTIFSAFPFVFQSENQFVKIYEVDYTRLESDIEVSAASAYPIHNSTIGSERLSSIVVEVKNIGLQPIEIASLNITYFDTLLGGIALKEVDQLGLTTNTGSFLIAPNESVIVNARLDAYFVIGSIVEVEVVASDLIPRLNYFVQVPARSAPAYNMSVIESECYAYANGTIHLELENTGAGYCEIDPLGWVQGLVTDIRSGTDRGLLLFKGERITVDLDAADVPIQVVEGTNITVIVFYMSRIPDYQGLNLTIELLVQPTPPSPAMPSSSETDPSTDSSSLTPDVYSVFSDCSVAWPLKAHSCVACNVFFMARRYFP